ncbi:Hypothetical predicted protein, partial [Pelobates cultripes]
TTGSHQVDSGSDSKGSKTDKNSATPFTKEDHRAMLRETFADIKAYTAAALEKQIAGLKEETSITDPADKTYASGAYRNKSYQTPYSPLPNTPEQELYIEQ